MIAAIEDLLRRQEGKTLEFKREMATAEPFLKTVVAFANTAGGTVVFGVEDRTRRVVGVMEPLDLEARIANVVSDAIRPRVAPDVDVVPWRRTHVVAVRVHSSPIRPHYVTALGPEQGVFVRVGSTNRPADRPMIDEMRRLAGNRSFDEEVVPDLRSEAIDFRAASELFASVRRLKRRDLRVLGLTAVHGGRLVPTVGGLLLFGRDRDRRFPDAYLQAGRFAGRDRARILDSVEIRTHLPRIVDEALAFLRKHECVALEIRGARHRERWPIPLPAAREAVINAVVHADYAQRGAPIRLSVFDDRIEVENPGLLPFGLTVEDIVRGVSKLRNRVLGRVFKELGLIEQWGSGIGRMVGACREAGLPAPRFEELGRHFRVSLFKERAAAPVADSVEQAILARLAGGRSSTTAEIARAVGRTSRATRTRLAGLVARGLVVEMGTGPRDPKRRYYLTREGG